MTEQTIHIGSRVVTQSGVPGVVTSFSFAHAWVRIGSGEVRFERTSSLVLA
jgi:preprotein translocase subunit YajC